MTVSEALELVMAGDLYDHKGFLSQKGYEALETLEDKNISEDKKGYWEAPDPDYDRDGERIPIRVAICSECQKPNRLPVGRYCSECGSYNAKEE